MKNIVLALLLMVIMPVHADDIAPMSQSMRAGTMFPDVVDRLEYFQKMAAMARIEAEWPIAEAGAYDAPCCFRATAFFSVLESGEVIEPEESLFRAAGATGTELQQGLNKLMNADFISSIQKNTGAHAAAENINWLSRQLVDGEPAILDVKFVGGDLHSVNLILVNGQTMVYDLENERYGIPLEHFLSADKEWQVDHTEPMALHRMLRDGVQYELTEIDRSHGVYINGRLVSAPKLNEAQSESGLTATEWRHQMEKLKIRARYCPG